MTLSRRHFLKTAAALSLGFTGLRTFLSGRDEAVGETGSGSTPFGPLQPDPEGIFDLPEEFDYQIISRVGEEMEDGFLVPHRADGMAAFPASNGSGRTLLVRNHEVSRDAGAGEGAFGKRLKRLKKLDSDAFYDARTTKSPCLGGTTTLLYDTDQQELIRQHLSLVGTLRNCAGGPTPWNTWISCEETVHTAGDTLRKDHGYPFEVPARPEPQLAEPKPIKAMGRFNHEAVAVHPKSGTVYQTEDRVDGLLYRYLPHKPGHLQQGGRLQALAIAGSRSMDTRNWDRKRVSEGKALPVEWIDLEQIHAPEDRLRYRGYEKGAARFARGEGMWFGNDAVYFACTNGGPAKRGQIWRYTSDPNNPSAGSGKAGQLELFVEAEEGGLLNNADNLTVSPWGDLIVCEDSDGEQNLVGVTPDGKLYHFARNAMSNSELAGSTFSPDGSTLFVNIQHEGLTLAITGPWQKRTE